MDLKTIIFKREKTSYWESGINIEGNEGNNTIIDKQGNIVNLPVYEIKDKNLKLYIDLNSILNEIEQIANKFEGYNVKFDNKGVTVKNPIYNPSKQ